MRGIARSPEPDYFDAIRCRYDSWEELYGESGQAVRECRGRCPGLICRGSAIDGLSGHQIRTRLISPALEAEFAYLCAYCEQSCHGTGQIEHFRPRTKFPDLWLNWLNLLYACRRCNSGKKGNLWPKEGDAVNRRYGKVIGFAPVTVYVDPNLVLGLRPAEEFFAFYLAGGNGGQITANSAILLSERLVAHRTIEDLDLNDDYGEVDKRLPELRTDELDDLLNEVQEQYGDPFDDIDTTQLMLDVARQSGQPFSSFIVAYVDELESQIN